MIDFTGKSVVVTGASRGIGKIIAQKFWLANAQVTITGRSIDSLIAAACEIESGHFRCDRINAIAADSTSWPDVKRAVREAINRCGKIDILVNNAGVQFPQPSIDVTEEHWNQTLDTNLKGYFCSAQSVANAWICQKQSGVIINIGSVQGVTVVVGQAVYAATKAAISHLTRSLAREWGSAGIRVNCVAPGSIPTAINASIYADPQVLSEFKKKVPLGRQGKADEVADAVLFLASDFASYITGQTLYVDGGLTTCHG
jgi:NAD(P)-dependent dehydrogenase (short-subunit alcohol dehydrogenase family)